MSVKEYRIVPTVRPITFPGVNSCVICNCGSVDFRVGIEVDHIGNNHIRCLECLYCTQKLAVPFFDDGLRRS